MRGLSLDALTLLKWRAFGAAHDPASSPAVVVAIDQESFTTPPFRNSPSVTWTREIGRVVTALLDGGAAAVGFDVVFPTSIEESEIPFDDQTLGGKLRGFDRDFLRALARGARTGKLVLGEVEQGADVVMPSAGQRVAVGQQRNIRALNVYSDSDGVVRRTPLMLKAGEGLVPSMSLELASRALGASAALDKDGVVALGDYRVPTRIANALTLNFDGGADAIPAFSFADLHACLDKGDAEFFARNFAGKVVLLGSRLDFEDDKLATNRFVAAPRTRTAPRCALPPSAAAPLARGAIDGVLIHATAVDNLMRRDAIAEIGDVPRWLLIGSGAVIATLAAVWLTPASAAAAILAMALGWTGLSTLAFARATALPLFEPMVAAFVALTATTSFRLFAADSDQRFLRRAFELYLAPKLIDRMLASHRPPALGGETREVTIFFSDVVGFSALSERMAPSELVALMNAYLSRMTDIIEAHGGFVDKYIGDAIVAIFGAPLEAEDHAARAVAAALACRAALEREAESERTSDRPRLAHRIGLNTGPALVGNIGSQRRFNYTAMGDNVNLASRLEGANTYFGTSVLASEATKSAAGEGFAWREIDTIRVKGRDQPLRVFEPREAAGGQAASYEKGLARWRARDFAGAAEAFAEAAASDPPSARFLTRARAMIDNPPGDDWRPVETLSEK